LLDAAVDWASLAKQWIAQREVMGMTSVASNSDTHYVSQPMQHVPAAPPPPPPPPQPSDDVTPGDLPPPGQDVAPEDSGTAQAHGLTSVLLSLSHCLSPYCILNRVSMRPRKSWIFFWIFEDLESPRKSVWSSKVLKLKLKVWKVPYWKMKILDS